MTRVKSQRVRLLDIFLYGPIMMIAALSSRPSPTMRASLFLIGVGTIIYNADNYFKIKVLDQYNNQNP